MDELRNPAVEGGRSDDAAQAYIAGRVKAGASRDAIVQELIQRGYEPAVAREMVGGVTRKHASSARNSGLWLLIGGLIITVVSVALTVASYAAAEPGGYYFVCCGLTVFGLYLTFRGIAQLIRGREVK
jgi:predicted phage tail protein